MNAVPPTRDIRVIATSLLALAWFTLPLAFSILLFAQLAMITDWLRGHQEFGPWIAAGGFAMCAGFGFLPTYAQAVLMGWVFGTAVGVPISVGGYVGGAVLGYGISRMVTGDAITRRIDDHPRWRVVRSSLVEASTWRTLGLVALLRFPPNSPFAFTNLVLAASGVRFGPMIIGSILGMLPRTFIAVWVGAQGAATGAKDLKELMEKQGLFALAIGFVILIGVLAIMQHVGKRALAAAGL
jgi:uncharacterized membrane protein YdjX (TVP38/TMEM64 family)